MYITANHRKARLTQEVIIITKMFLEFSKCPLFRAIVCQRLCKVEWWKIIKFCLFWDFLATKLCATCSKVACTRSARSHFVKCKIKNKNSSSGFWSLGTYMTLLIELHKIQKCVLIKSREKIKLCLIKFQWKCLGDEFAEHSTPFLSRHFSLIGTIFVLSSESPFEILHTSTTSESWRRAEIQTEDLKWSEEQTHPVLNGSLMCWAGRLSKSLISSSTPLSQPLVCFMLF